MPECEMMISIFYLQLKSQILGDFYRRHVWYYPLSTINNTNYQLKHVYVRYYLWLWICEEINIFLFNPFSAEYFWQYF